METERLKILLIDDVEKDYTLIRDTLSKIPDGVYELDWVSSLEEASKNTGQVDYDICLVGFRLGSRTGIEIMQELQKRGCKSPFILLTGDYDYELDIQAMRGGVADCLEKKNMGSPLLERTIRYAQDREKTHRALKESEKRRRQLTKKLVRAQEEERERIARELHDGIGANLAAIKYALEEIRLGLPEDFAGRGGMNLDQIIPMVKGTIEEISRISSDLRPSILDDMGVVAAIQWTCRKTNEIYPALSVTTQIGIQEEEIPEPLKIDIYRIVQEALNNIAKHSDAKDGRVSLSVHQKEIVLLIADNGMGFDADALLRFSSDESMGLEGMEERAVLSGGQFEIISEEGKGTKIRAWWPLGGH